MASTYTPQDAIDLTRGLAHGIPVDQVAATMCDIVHSMMWCYYPWRWAQAPLSAIDCVDGTQDYTPTDTDILRPVSIRIARTDLTPVESRELDLLANLSPELTVKGGLNRITSAGWIAGNMIRLGIAASVGTGETLQIQGEYQKKPTKITAATLGDEVPFPDHFFGCFVEGLTWKIYQLSDDPRAGTSQLQTTGGARQRVYTGQLSLFRDCLQDMAATEDLGSGDQFQWPESPLGVGSSGGVGLFGF